MKLIDRSIEGIDSFERPHLMEEFDNLVLRAAFRKRQDIVDRYGDEECVKLLAKEKRRKKEIDPDFAQMNYDRTTQAVLEVWGSSSWNNSRKITNGEIVWSRDPRKIEIVEKAWRWQCSGRIQDKCESQPTDRNRSSSDKTWQWWGGLGKKKGNRSEEKARRHSSIF